MAAINTLIKEINKNLYDNKFDKAYGLYKEIIKDKREYWKISIIDVVIEAAKAVGFNFMFTQNYAELLIVDTKNNQILMLWLTKEYNFAKENKSYYTWIERTRQALEDETIVDYGYQVNVLHIIYSDDESVLNELSYQNDRFYTRICDNESIFDNCIPADQSVITIKEDILEDVMQFCFDMASDLADMEYKPKDSDKEITSDEEEELQDEEEEEEKEPLFNVLEIAPESFLDFLLNNETASESMDIEEMFKLSLHSVIASDNQSKNDDFVKCIHRSLTRKNNKSDDVSIVHYDILSIGALNDIKSFLNDQHSKIVVIENLEASINPYLNFKKPDIIRILCKELDTSIDVAFVLTVTKKGWQQLVAEFPQLRVFFQNIFVFDEPKIQNLINHFKGELDNYELTLSESAEALVKEFFNYIKQSQNPQLFDFPMSSMLAKEARYYQTVRNSKNKTENNHIIERNDIEKAIEDEYVLDEKCNLVDVLAKIDKLTGLENVKSQIRDIAALVKINRLRKNHNSKSSTPISLNTLFLGNPGTGKTTVARYLGEVFRSIGALQKGHVIAVSRQDIVKRFIGHTEENFISIINKARGGILFIDEAYSLYNQDTDNDFGRDAINVLVDRLDDIREHTSVILGGYPEPMQKFMSSNPGLASRFPTTISFKDYSEDELSHIFMSFVHTDNFNMNEEAEKRMSSYIGKLVENKDEHFGNGRTMRNAFEKLKLIQARRITYSDIDNSTDLNLFTTEDIDVLLKEMDSLQETKKQKLGYRVGKG